MKDAVKVIDEVQGDEVIELARTLVRINSVWDPQDSTSEKEVAEFVAGWASKEGFQVCLDEVADGRPNVIIVWEPGGGPLRLMFEAHMDVVTPGDVSQWTHDPFGGEIEGGKLYGRGANDTKGNLAAMLVAMAALKRSGIAIPGAIVAGVLCDEEGLMLGVQDFIKRGHADGITGAIICEPQDGLICPVQKGAIRARFLTKGKMSHGAMPLSGLNPLPMLARIVLGLGELEREAIDIYGQDPFLGWPSFTPTVIRAPVCGPPQLNVVPGSGELLVDIRTIPSQSHKDIIQRLAALGQRVREETRAHYRRSDELMGVRRELSVDVEVEVLADRPCTKTPLDHPVVRSVHWAMREVTGKEPQYGGVPGATDGTYLWALKNIPIVTTGAGQREVPHQVDEWVDIEDLVTMAKVYALAALAYLRSAE